MLSSAARKNSTSELVVLAANVVLAVLAFAREATLGALLGTTGEADAFFLAQYVPDIEANMILSQATLFAAVPVMTGFSVGGDRDALERFTNALAGGALAGAAVLGLLNAVGAGLIVSLLGSGMAPGSRVLASHTLLLMTPSIPGYLVYSAMAARLQVESMFTAPAFGPVLMNVVFLLGAATCVSRFGPVSLGAWFSAGVIAMACLQAHALLRAGVSFRPKLDAAAPGFGPFWTGFAPVAATQAILQLGSSAEKLLAGWLGEGAVASLSYAFKLTQVPVWVFVAALGTVAFPALSRAVERGDRRELASVLESSLGLTLFVTIPASAALVMLARPVVATLFMRGVFTVDSVRSTAATLTGYAPSAVSQGVLYLFMRACLALRQARQALAGAALGCASMIALDFCLAPRLGLTALGIGATGGMGLAAVYMLLAVRGRVDRVRPARVLAVGAAYALRCVPMLLALWLLRRCLLGNVEHLSLQGRIIALGVTVCAGLTVYLATCWASGSPEVRWLRAVVSGFLLFRFSRKGCVP